MTQRDLNLAVIEPLRTKLHRIHDDYRSGYDAAFEEHNAFVSFRRWCDRTTKIIEERLGHAEAMDFRRAVASGPRGRGSWYWGELCEYYDTYLVRLGEDIIEYPDDLADVRASQNEVSDSVSAHNSPKSDSGGIFLSYSRDDRDEARSIYDALIKAGRECFLDEKNLQPGDRFEDEIRDAIATADEVWIVVSPSSLKSTWVQREAAAAWALKKRTVPILFRCGAGDLPEFLTGTNAIDLHNVFSYIEQSL
jgi:hypothetical protein